MSKMTGLAHGQEVGVHGLHLALAGQFVVTGPKGRGRLPHEEKDEDNGPNDDDHGAGGSEL